MSGAAPLTQATTDPSGMRRIEGGRFRMGSASFYPEEGPVRTVAVDSFFIDIGPVTNADFARFVSATGYVTTAEQTPDPAMYPGADPALLTPGSLVFRKPAHAADMRFWGDWWNFVAGAAWHRPDGATPLDTTHADHPVVHVSQIDAAAYAQWAGKALPSEAEWELAARGGLDGLDYAWGPDFEPDGIRLANTWDGAFPILNADARFGTTPIGRYPANGYGLFDMIGNVWEWTDDFWSDRHPAPGASEPAVKACCIPKNPRNLDADASLDPNQPAIRIPRKVVKGGSYLCAPNYCRRYRPAARHAVMIDSGTSHVGFRCVRRDAGPTQDAPPPDAPTPDASTQDAARASAEKDLPQ